MTHQTIQDLQLKLYEWQNYNFGPQPNDRLLLGICEEAGELCHSALKKFQGIRGTPEQHMANMKDAIGDMMIYTLNYLNGVGQKCCDIPRPTLHVSSDESIQTAAVFDIVRHASVLTMSRAPFIAENILSLINALNYFCSLNGWDLEQITHETCTEVCKRDWKLYPKTGFPDSEESK